jgi:multimeric flavodoxin WrbA
MCTTNILKKNGPRKNSGGPDYLTMAKVLIIYHSQTGNTESLARSVARGVDETEHALAMLQHASRVTARDVRECDAIVICSPEYFGYMAGAIKHFFDRTYEELKDDARIWKKPFSIVISAGNDGTGALAHIERICKGYRFKKVQHPIVCKGPVTDEILVNCYELGMTIAEGINAGIF